MESLNLPVFDIPTREGPNGHQEIWDLVRKKFVALTPEEWVRQHFLHYLIACRNYPASLIGVEVPLQYNRLKKRSDIVAYNRNGDPLLVVECKAPEIALTRDVLCQAAMYNRSLAGKVLVLTNGLVHYACRIDPTGQTLDFLNEIPDYTAICQ